MSLPQSLCTLVVSWLEPNSSNGRWNDWNVPIPVCIWIYRARGTCLWAFKEVEKEGEGGGGGGGGRGGGS